MRRQMGRLWTLGLLTGLMVAATPAARADDYILGPDDVISISVWLHPELERVVTVSAGGTIVFPPVGEVAVAGLTPRQLGERLADKVTAYLRQAATVNVTVRDFLSHSVQVAGAVSRPGRYGFEHIPSVVDVIGQAGGALTGADLSRVQVVRQDGEQRHTLIADVGSVMRDGSVQNLPKLKPGDTVIVPALQSGAAAAATDGVSVLGEVARPGIYPATGGVDLWSLLASAGGFTARADLRSVRILKHERDAQAVSEVNLSAAMTSGPRGSTVVQPGDVVIVSATHPGIFSQFSGLLQVTTSALSIAVLIDVLKRGGHY